MNSVAKLCSIQRSSVQQKMIFAAKNAANSNFATRFATRFAAPQCANFYALIYKCSICNKNIYKKINNINIYKINVTCNACTREGIAAQEIGEYLESLIKQASPRWEGVRDADEWVAEMRGAAQDQ